MNDGATFGESLLFETSTNMWQRLSDTRRSPFKILRKLHFIGDQNELKLDLNDNFGETLQYEILSQFPSVPPKMFFSSFTFVKNT